MFFERARSVDQSGIHQPFKQFYVPNGIAKKLTAFIHLKPLLFSFNNCILQQSCHTS